MPSLRPVDSITSPLSSPRTATRSSRKCYATDRESQNEDESVAVLPTPLAQCRLTRCDETISILPVFPKNHALFAVPFRSGLEISKIHSNLSRAVTCAGFAYFVNIGGLTSAIRVIRVEAIVWNGYPQHTVTVNVDAA
jgi:hypothetical protein